MKTITHDLMQGSDEWIAFRYNHDGASEISAVLGISKNTKRNELLKIKHTGIGKEFSDYVQRMVLDKGHEVESLARPIVEKIIGSDLYPVTISRGRMSASCDGLTITDDEGWENKQYNAEYFAMVQAGEVPEEHMPQVQQCLLVTGAGRWFFTISDGTEERTVGVWVYPDAEYFEKIQAAWDQFNKDLESYVFEAEIIAAKADPVMSLPSLSIQVGGSISIQSNLEKFGERLKGFISETNAKPETDQDFANLEQACKVLKEAEDALKQAESNALAQTVSVDEMRRTVAFLADMARTNRLQFEKLVKSEKEARKVAIVSKAKIAFTDHFNGLQSEIKGVQLSIENPNFPESIKGKKTLSSMQDAVDTMLANAKIEADRIAKDLREKLAWCAETSKGYGFLFNDLQSLIYKPVDDFQLAITARIESHKDAEAAKLESERERIRLEEEAKARREAEAKVRADQAEKERIVREAQQAEEQEKERAAQKEEQERMVDNVDTGEQNRGDKASPVQAVDAQRVEKQDKFVSDVSIPAQSKVSQSIETVRLPNRNQIISTIMAKYFLTDSEALKAIELAFNTK